MALAGGGIWWFQGAGGAASAIVRGGRSSRRQRWIALPDGRLVEPRDDEDYLRIIAGIVAKRAPEAVEIVADARRGSRRPAYRPTAPTRELIAGIERAGVLRIDALVDRLVTGRRKRIEEDDDVVTMVLALLV